MAKYQNQIEYSITTKLDSKGLTQLQSQIKEVEASLKRLSSNDLNDSLKFNEPIRQLQELNKALSSSFNSSLGMLDLSKFKAQIQSAGVTAKDLGVAFKNSGAQGQIAMNNLLGQIGKIDTGLKRSSTTVDKMFNTISNTVRWGIVSSGFSAMLNSLHQSVDYVKELDDSLTQIMLVTDYSRQQMDEYAKSANEAAKALGATTVDVTKGSQVFAQQGFDLQQSSQLAELSIKLANASEQDSATTSDQITALMNAYHISGDIDALNKALDSWAEVANISAADVEELAKASQKAASSASVMGVSLDQMNAQIATIESVTRDAPEQIGNGLKTLYSRMTDISEGKTDEEGFDLGKVTKELDSVGVSVMNEMGQIRSVGDIIEDLMVIWKDLDETSKQAAGQAIAGKYQLNRFYALMENSDMYQEYKEGSTNASGTLNQMNEEYINSMAGKTAKLQATLEGLFNSVFNPDNFYPAVDALTNFIDLIKKLVDSLGGGQTVLTGVVALFGRLFSNNMAQMINDANINRKIEQARKENALNVPDTLKQLGFTDPTTFQGQASKDTVDFIMKGQEALPNMSEQQAEQYNRILLDITNNSNMVTRETEKMEKAIRAAGIIGAAAQDTALGQDVQGLAEMLSQFSQGEILKQYAQNFKEGKNAAIEFKESLLTVISMQKDFESSTLTMDQKADKLKNVFNSASNALQDFREAGVLQTEKFNQMAEQLENLENQMINFETSADQNENELKELTLEAVNFIEAIQGLESGKITKESLLKILNTGPSNLIQGDALQRRYDSEAKAFNEGRDDQKRIKSIIDTTSAIGELAFAWQSFQNLGSIWNNTDLNDGEKLLQTITNLSFVIPSLINSIKTLKTASKEIDWSNIFKINIPKDSLNFGEGFQKLKNEQQQLEEQLTIKQKQQQAARKGMASTAQKYGTDSRYFKQQSGTYYNRSQDIADIKKQMSDLDLNFGKATENVTKGFDTLTTKQKIFITASKAANKATSLLGSAIEGLTSPIGMAGMALVGLIANMHQMKEQAEQTNINNLFEDYQKATENRNIDITQFDDLYNDYTKTHNASDELINISKTLGEQLGIVGDQALINAGNFEELSKKIHEAATASDEMAKKAADKTINAITGAEKQHYMFTNDFGNRFSFLPGSGDTIATRTGINYGILGQDESGLNALEKYQAIVKALSEAEENLKNYEAQLDEVKDKGLQGHQLDIFNDQIEHEKAIQRDLSEALAIEDMEKIKTIIDTEAAALEESLPEKAKDFSNKSLQEVINTLTDSEGEFKYLGEKIKAITGESGEEAGKEFLLRLIQSLSGDKLDVADILSSFGKIDSTKINKDTKEKITNLDLTEEDFKALGFDSAEAFWRAFEKALQDFSKEKTLDIETNLRPKQEQEKVQKDLDISNEKYDTIKSTLFNENENLQALAQEAEAYEQNKNFIEERDKALRNTNEALEKQNKALEQQNNSLDKNSYAYEKNQQNIIQNNHAIERNNKALEENSSYNKYAKDQLESLENKIIETAAGAEELSKVWEENSKILADGNSNFYERASAIDNLIPGLSHLLNLDPSVLKAMNDDFFTSTQNLNDMEAAINGDVEALQRLRGAAAEQILIQAGVDPNSDLYGQMLSLISAANAYLPMLEAGATIDDTAFQAILQNMVQSMIAAGMDVERVMNTLTALGIEMVPDGSTQMQIPTPEVQAKVDRGVFTAMHDPDMAKGMSGTAIRTELTMHYETIDVSNYKFRKTSGGKGFNGGASYTPKSSKGGGGGSCFVANTLVTMHGFYKKIQEVAKGDIVLSYNETTKTNEYSQVVQTMIHSTTEEIYTLSIKNEQLRVTGIHRFFIKRNNSIDWIEASNLKVGDLVFLANGIWSKILNISVNIETRYVYNFEVSNNHNYYVGINRILAHNKGGGGGGGGSGKTYEPKTKEPIKEEIDLYEKVNTQLDDVEETLKGIQQETDRLIGARGRANMNKQIKLLQKEIDLQREKLKIQEKERNDLGRQLSSNFGVTFDSEGFIDNYAATLKRLEKAHNDLVNQYNATGTEEGQAALEEQIEKAKENIDEFKDLYKRYDELQGKEIKDTINQIEELDDSIEDLRIDAYKAAQEAIDDLKDIEDTAAELLKTFSKFENSSPFAEILEQGAKLDNILGTNQKSAQSYYKQIIKENEELARTSTDSAVAEVAKARAEFFKQQLASGKKGTALEASLDDLQRLQGWWNNPNSSDNIFGKNTQALYEAYLDAYNRTAELYTEAKEGAEDYRDTTIDMLDDIWDRQEKIIEGYEKIADRLTTIGDIDTLFNGEDSYANMQRMYYQISQTYADAARTWDQRVDYWTKQVAKTEGVDEKLHQEALDKLDEAKQNVLDAQKEVVDNLKESFQNALNEIDRIQNQKVLGRNSIENTRDDWERDNDFAERYYDEVQKANLVEQLRLKYMNLLDDAQGSSLDIQRKIRDSMNEQVKYLETQNHLSDFNVKYANAQLEILQKQIALEDARNNKNQMRLRRDTQGNYRYVYSANQDDIRQKQQDLLQTEFDAYNMSTENRRATMSDWISLYQNYMDKRQELIQRMNQGDQEAADALVKLEEDFVRDMKGLSEELGDSWEGMMGALQWMAETGTDTIKDMAEKAMTAIEEKTDDSLGEVGIQWNETIDNAINNIDNLVNAFNTATTDMKDASKNYREYLVGEDGKSGFFGEVKSGYHGINDAIITAKESTDELKKSTDLLNKSFSAEDSALNDAIRKVEQYRNALSSTNEDMKALKATLDQTQRDLAKVSAENQDWRTGLRTVDDPTGEKRKAAEAARQNNNTGDRSIREGRKVRILTSYAVSSDSGYISNPLYGPGSIMYIQNVPGWGVGPINGKVHVGTETRFGWDTQVGWIRPQDLEFLDTGGYTGDWNTSEGKIAMLHQKELVLNASDTENILQAVDMVRNMAEMLKTFSGMSVKGTGFNKLGGDTIEQRVEITAEFPNVQDSKEIENALLNIADSAYQYSYRTR